MTLKTDEELKPVPASQADGYVADAEEAIELVDEMVSTTVLYDTFGRFITYLAEAFNHLEDVSEECNPVITHLTIQGYHEAVINSAHTLRDELIEKLAQRGEQITEKGGTLRTQVLNDEDEDS
jgi:F0F1-type ATP synthase delta subunit